MFTLSSLNDVISNDQPTAAQFKARSTRHTIEESTVQNSWKMKVPQYSSVLCLFNRTVILNSWNLLQVLRTLHLEGEMLAEL